MFRWCSIFFFVFHFIFTGRKLVSISTTQDGVELLLRNTNPLNPVHNIRLIMPGFENRYERFPFYPPFLETIKRYSELRFMEFMHTNGHEVYSVIIRNIALLLCHAIMVFPFKIWVKRVKIEP